MHPKKERTFVAVKPDGVQRSLIGEIIGRFEKVGLKLVAMKMLVPKTEHIEKQYTMESLLITADNTIKSYQEKGVKPPSEDREAIAKTIHDALARYLSSGPIVAMVWEGAHAVKLVRKIVGATEPLSSDVGTIRGDFLLDSYAMADSDNRAVRNIVHASGKVEEAEQEIAIWFKPEDVIDYKLVQESILYDVNLDGILE